jgi:hypothetical protein
MMEGEGLTFHVTFTLVNDKGVSSRAALLVSNDPDSLDGAVHLELASDVCFGGFLGLWAFQSKERVCE